MGLDHATRRRSAGSAGMIRLNLGSGQRPFDKPFVNVDINPKWEPDVVADGASMPMFADGSSDMIVLHHTLEHYGCGEGSAMLQECHRILAPGGSLIVCVPEMRELAKMWLRGTLDTQVYMTNVYGAFMDSEADRHRWGGDSLSWATYLMSVAPWNRVTTFDWREIPGASIAKDVWICGLECVK